MLSAEVSSAHCAVKLNVLSLPDKSLQSAHVLSGEAIPETLPPDPQNKSAAGFSCSIQPNIPWPLIRDSVAYKNVLNSNVRIWAGAWTNKEVQSAWESHTLLMHDNMTRCPQMNQITAKHYCVNPALIFVQEASEKRTSHITPKGPRFKCPPTPHHHPGLCPPSPSRPPKWCFYSQSPNPLPIIRTI